MKIGILGEMFFKEEHLARLKALGEVSVITADSNLSSFDTIAIDMWETKPDSAFFSRASNLKFLILNSTAFDLVDFNAAKAKGIKISNLPGYSTEAVAEHALALALSVIRKIPKSDRDVKAKPFEVDPAIPSQRVYSGFELKGRTLGVVGLGNIGTRMAEIGLALGMKVVGFNRSPKKISGVEQVELEELLKVSDVVSLHLPMAPGLDALIGAAELALMKPTAVIVNTGRGQLIDPHALYEALRGNKLAGAGLDVLANGSDPLLTLENVVVTPHSAFYTEEAMTTLADTVTKNIEAFASGKPINLVGQDV